MSILVAIILGIVQGLTEFLPVSSSGHLELAKWLLKDDSLGEESLMMTVVLHVGTALSTIVVFRKDIFIILQDLVKFQWNESTQFAAKIIVSMIPAAIIGVLFEEQIETLFEKQILLVGGMLVATGILLYFANKAKNTGKNVTFLNALLVGTAQAIAILPGLSRSGATISTSVLLGIDKSNAARFSFLMVVPLIFGKLAKDLLDNDFAASSVEFMPILAGFIASFVTGLFACSLMIRLVKQSKLIYFSIYCILVGIFAAIFYTWN